jgi:hypothetical protein
MQLLTIKAVDMALAFVFAGIAGDAGVCTPLGKFCDADTTGVLAPVEGALCVLK